MQTITEAQANALLSLELLGDNTPLVYIKLNSIQLDIPIIALDISKEYGSIAQQATITIANVNPSIIWDTGYYNAQREHPENNKPTNSYHELIKPGEEVEIIGGYYGNTVTIMTGVIRTVKINIMCSADALMQLTVREKSQMLVDGTIHHTSSGTRYHYINYPIEAGVDTFSLTAADTNPYLYEIWEDVCLRAGFTAGEVNVDTSCTIRLNDIDGDSFQNITGKWSDLTKRLTSLMYYVSGSYSYPFYQYEDQDGEIHLKLDLFDSYRVLLSDAETHVLNGIAYEELDNKAGYSERRAIEDSILVVDNSDTNIEYSKDVDWEFDYASNSIRRIDTGAIGDGDTVRVSYSFINWLFKSEHTFDITQWLSHDEVYSDLVIKNDELGLERSLALDQLGDSSTFPENKIKISDVQELTTNTQIDNLLNSQLLDMKKNYYNMECEVICIPQLQIGDLVTSLIYGTLTSIYKIMGFDIKFNAESGLSMQIRTVFFNTAYLVTDSFFITADSEYFQTSDTEFFKVQTEY